MSLADPAKRRPKRSAILFVLANRRRRRGNPGTRFPRIAQQCWPATIRPGLPRRCAPRNDEGEACGRAGARLATFVTPGSTRGPAAFVPRGSTPAGAPPPWTNPSPRHCEPPQAARQSMTEACRPAPTQSLSRDVTRSIASPLGSSQRGKRDPGSSPGRREVGLQLPIRRVAPQWRFARWERLLKTTRLRPLA